MTCGHRGRLCGDPDCGNCYDRSLQEHLDWNNLNHCWIQEKNEGVIPVAISAGSSKRCVFLCKRCGREYSIAINSFVKSKGCYECRGSREHKYDPTLAPCEQREHFLKMIHNHQGNGYPVDIDKESLNAIEFIALAIETFGDRYDYSRVKYTGNGRPVEILCTRHGSFMKRPYQHLLGNGCTKCKWESTRKTTEQFIQDAIKVHGHRYNYDRVDYVFGRTPVEILCPRHGSFMQRPTYHLSGKACSSCRHKTEGILMGWLRNEYPNREIVGQYRLHTLTGRKYDFYISSLNLIIELDGPQHFRQIGNWDPYRRTQKIDTTKEIAANESGITVIHIQQEDVAYDRYNWDDRLKSLIKSYDVPKVVFMGSEVYMRHKYLLRCGRIIYGSITDKTDPMCVTMGRFIDRLNIGDKGLVSYPCNGELNILSEDLIREYRIHTDCDHEYLGIIYFMENILGIAIRVEIEDGILSVEMDRRDSMYHLIAGIKR